MQTSQTTMRPSYEAPTARDRMSLMTETTEDPFQLDQFRRDSRSGSVIDFMNSSVYEEENSFNDDPTNPDNRNSLNKKKINDADAKFVIKKDWQKNKNCNVCERVMDKLKGVSPHHCRICAFGVCGDCSKRRVNSLRVCDVCFVKQAFKEDEIQRNETVNSRGDKLVKAQDKLKYDKEEVVRKREELEEFERKIKSDSLAYDDAMQKFKNEKIQKSNDLEKKRGTTQSLKNNISSGKKDVNERESKLNELKVKISALKLELSQKKAIFEDKQVEFGSLKETVTVLQHQAKSQGPHDSQPEAEDKVSFVSGRNLSLVSPDNNGKYNISLQPVNI